MLLDDEVVGAISLVRNEVDPFDDRAISPCSRRSPLRPLWSSATCTSCASSERAAQKLGRKVEQLEALSEVGELVSSSLVLDEVLSNIIMNAVRFSGCDGGSIMEYVEDAALLLGAQRLREQSRAAREAAHDPHRSRRPRSSAGPALEGHPDRRGRPRTPSTLDPHLRAALRRRLALGDRRADAARRAHHRSARRAPKTTG